MDTISEFNYKAAAGCQLIPAARVAMGLFLLSILIVGGCATGATYFQQSNDIAAQFEKGRILDGYRYYLGGPVAKPNAIVALKDGYHLESEYWRLYAATPDALKKMVERISQVDGVEAKQQQMISNGARIMDGGGGQIGIWYSVYDYSQVRLLDAKRVYLSSPPARLPINVRRFRTHSGS
ncbi:MAG: hypothetical protein P8X96_09285 [Desulfobacteraceae bacterium]